MEWREKHQKSSTLIIREKFCQDIAIGLAKLCHAYGKDVYKRQGFTGKTMLATAPATTPASKVVMAVLGASKRSMDSITMSEEASGLSLIHIFEPFGHP